MYTVMLTRTWASRPRPSPRPRTWVTRPRPKTRDIKVKFFTGLHRTPYIIFSSLMCRDITGRLTMQTCLDLPEDPIF